MIVCVLDRLQRVTALASLPVLDVIGIRMEILEKFVSILTRQYICRDGQTESAQEGDDGAEGAQIP